MMRNVSVVTMTPRRRRLLGPIEPSKPSIFLHNVWKSIFLRPVVHVPSFEAKVLQVIKENPKVIGVTTLRTLINVPALISVPAASEQFPLQFLAILLPI